MSFKFIICKKGKKKALLKGLFDILYSALGVEVTFPNLANFLLNLSILPAVSTNFILPVKNGCEAEEISNLIRGYSFPSSQTMVSFASAHELDINETSHEKSLKITFLYSFGWISFFITK